VSILSVAVALQKAAAVDALINRIEGAAAGDVMIREPMRLVQRGSVAPPSQSRPKSANMPGS